MGWWIGLIVVVIVVLLALGWVARKVRAIEDDSTYLSEEQGFTPYGSRFMRMLGGRRRR